MASPTKIDEEEVDTFLEFTAKTRNTPIEKLDGYRSVLLGFLKNFDEEQLVHWAAKQSYLALGQVLTSAAMLGIDACPMEGFIPAEYDRILGLTHRHLTSSVACAFGYRAEEDKYATMAKVRYPSEDVIERI